MVAIITRTFETAFEILASLTTLAKYGTLVDIVAIMWVTLCYFVAVPTGTEISRARFGVFAGLLTVTK